MDANRRDTAAVVLASALEADAAHHRAGEFCAIGRRFGDVDAELFPIEDDWSVESTIAYSFWDGWVDARNHDWLYYPGIAASDWPDLADEIADALRRGSPISNPVVLARFSPRSQSSFWQRLRARSRSTVRHTD